MELPAASRCRTPPGHSTSWHRSRTPADVGYRDGRPSPRAPLPRRVFEGSRRARSATLQRSPQHQVLRGASRSPLARRFVGGKAQSRGRAGRLEVEDEWHRGTKPWSMCCSRRDRGEGEKGESRKGEKEVEEKEKEEAKERPFFKVQKRRLKKGKREEEKDRHGEEPLQFIQLDKQLIHRRVQGGVAGGAVPGVRDGPKHPDSKEAAPSGTALGPAVSAPEGREQVSIVGRRGRIGPERGSGFRRTPEDQRDRFAVPRSSQCTGNRTDAGPIGAGAWARSTSRRSVEHDISQILQTNTFPQDVRSDAQRSPNALDYRRSIIEGHGPGRPRHPHPAPEVAGSPVDGPCMDVLTENGIIAPRRGKPFVEAGTINSGSRASGGSEGPSSRGLEGVEQMKGRKSRKG